MSFELNHLVAYLPGLIVLSTALLLLVVELLPESILSARGHAIRAGVALAGSTSALFSLREFFISPELELGLEGHRLFGEMVAVDGLSLIAMLSLFLTTLFVTLMTASYFQRMKESGAEYYLLLFLALFGMVVVVTSVNLVSMLVGIEILSIALYLLSAYFSGTARSLEAGLKYLVLGILASGLMVYGIAFLFGATANLGLSEIEEALASGAVDSTYLWIGFALLLSGLAFKISAVPFHMWTPDVYQGAPLPITAFMSVAVKFSVIIFLMRLLAGTFFTMLSTWHSIVWLLALLSIFVGNILAIQQRSLKRLLAFSSISHAGYLLLGFVAMNGNLENSTVGILFYLIMYAVMNLGAFGSLIFLVRDRDPDPELSDIRGLGWRHPGMGALLSLFFLALAGLPPTAGFVAKWLVFASAIEAGHTMLVVLAVLGSAIGAYYYLRVIVHLYMLGENPQLAEISAFSARADNLYLAPVLVCGVLTLGIGVYPEPIIALARYAFPFVF